MEIIGNIYSRTEKEQKMATFVVQEFILDASYFDNYSQTNRENFLKFQVSNKGVEKLAELGDGDRVKVFFSISGGFFKKQDGEQGHMQRLNAFAFELIKSKEQKPVQETQSGEVPY